MAKRGTQKHRSVQQESYIAARYEGVRSPSSGGAVSDSGDVRNSSHLIECKQTGEHGKEKKSISVKLDDFEKIADEAWSEGREPMVALCIYNPSSVLADNDGNVHIIARLIEDDLSRGRD